MDVSVLILTHNCEDFIENCLKSAEGWAAEIVIVDDGSTDETLAICKKHKCRIIKHDWEGYSAQRTFAASQAKHDWIFYLDPDERLTKELKQEINNLQPQDNVNAYSMKRENVILGKILKKGGWYPDMQTRLIKRSALNKWVGELHEYPDVNGGKGELEKPLIHLTHRGINWSLGKTAQYTDAVAKLLYKDNHPKIQWYHLITAPLREFWYRGIEEQGLFEGMEGYIKVIYQTFDAFIAYTKVWELQKGKSMDQLYQEIDEQFIKEGKY